MASGCNRNGTRQEEGRGGFAADAEVISKLSKDGKSIRELAATFNLTETVVVRMLIDFEGVEELAERLRNHEPEKLCCPISHELMEEPMVAADGQTYEKECIQRHLASHSTSPVTRAPIQDRALNTNQHMKSEILEFKENRVLDILAVAPNLLDSGFERPAAELLAMAEKFLSKPDSIAARKKRAELLFLLLVLPSDPKRPTVLEELLSLIAEMEDADQLTECLRRIDQSEVQPALRKMPESSLEKLAIVARESTAPNKKCIDMVLQQKQDSHLGRVWDLAGYDFTTFSKGDSKKSSKFQISEGVNGWMKIFPKGSAQSPPGKAGLFLHVDSAVRVEVKFQCGQVSKTLKHDYSTNLSPEGNLQNRGWSDFMDASAVNGASIACYVLSVEAGSVQTQVWNLSDHDFRNFLQGDGKMSDKFPISEGVNGWMEICPKGSAQSPPGKASLFLHVDSAVRVEVKFQCGQVSKTLKHDYSTSLSPQGNLQGRGFFDFMDASAVHGASIAMHFLSVQRTAF